MKKAFTITVLAALTLVAAALTGCDKKCGVIYNGPASTLGSMRPVTITTNINGGEDEQTTGFAYFTFPYLDLYHFDLLVSKTMINPESDDDVEILLNLKAMYANGSIGDAGIFIDSDVFAISFDGEEYEDATIEVTGSLKERSGTSCDTPPAKRFALKTTIAFSVPGLIGAEIRIEDR